jgi:ATP-binding cassette subfamily C protein CydD
MSGAAASQRIHEILDTPLPPSPTVTQNTAPLLFDTITFQNLSYSYNEGQRQALDRVNFTLNKGQRVALVGPSGSGKSTVAQLLLRFIEPQEGLILADNTPLSQIVPGEWRKLVGWVPQNPYLFNDTIAQNIRLGKEDATEAEVIAAAQQANIHDFVQTLPQGYATVIGEKGARLSGGQAQRLSLARAYLKNAPLLILDEATSNLDPENEAQVLEATARLMAGRTVLIIAHRMNTIIGADKIIVLNEGKVVQSGTHHTLQYQTGLYSQLVGSGGGIK